MKRFRGAMIAGVILVVLAAGYGLTQWLNQPPPVVDETPQIFSFEKEDLRGVKLERSDGTLEFKMEGDDWVWVGKNWRPSASMVRRVGHQTHDLTARATVADPEDLDQYGFGDKAINITLTLAEEAGERTIAFQAGAPNPTSVSWYVRPMPGDVVYVVKKSAVDYWRMDELEFRERRFAALDAEKAVAIDATVDDRSMSFRLADGDVWQQTAPVEQPADRQAVRTMIGRTSALKTSQFVEDAPADKAQYGLEPPRHTVQLRADDGETITLYVGTVIPGTDPQERYVYRVEDDAVYAARDSFLEAFTEDLQHYRNTKVLRSRTGELATYTVETPTHEALTVTRSPDGYRWPDGQPIPGQTPKMLAQGASSLKAEGFHDAPVSDADFGLDDPAAVIDLTFSDADPLTISIGDEFDHMDALATTATQRRYVRISGDPSVYEVDAMIMSSVDSLLNEYRHKLERDEEKGLLDDTDVAEPADGAGG